MSRPSKQITQFVEMNDKNKIMNEKKDTPKEQSQCSHSS